MSKEKLSVRNEAILRMVWSLNHAEKQMLDKFFLLHSTWREVEPDVHASEEQGCLFLRQDGIDYQIILLDTMPRIRVAEDLGLSFRINYTSSLKVVLIRPWEQKDAAA